ncbi:putative (S)-scoulerine 9-O-methyltransferase [Rosa chinensis]|uniref:Putative (S)-scoulerine 9-O-methyltransferase n=1 Tax=Rosa chinensis TaxID=74649 RepID=A0A2P6Q5T8_ROSCH|nr:(S)-scoulerine 9-O-methyltransferase [Rosa chinensis]XP_040362174.1 (S)-scoulerine 9-O-methyltransferase [Rosa chinensis]PRQ29542.1 putative (S)-scoulerine 9-O-methyltransferase [Rosa chinensis]
METQGSLENYVSVWNLGDSVCIQMALRAAIELDVFNIIAKSGPEAHLTSKEIVSAIPTTNPNVAAKNLERILKLLSVNSLLSTSLKPSLNDKTPQERAYGLTKNALCLLPNEDGVSITPIIMSGSEMHAMQSLYMLKHSVLEPESVPFSKFYGENFYEYMSHKPETFSLFNKLMRTTSYLYFDQKVLKVYRGFEEVKELMDVGGGDGSSLAKIVSMYPHIHGINFNLPSVIAQAPKYQGVKHVSGDMFDSIPKTQSIILKWVLHNWDDEHCKKILRNCWEALPETGKVIVVEYFMLPEELENTPETMQILKGDVIMMAFFYGKERTIAEIDNLAKCVGFIETKIVHVSHGTYVIEFLKIKH